jgi:hypothetical protein
MKNNPNFICIAPHKTGTTWLYAALKQHPMVWLPPKKELWILNQLNEPYLERCRQYIHRTGKPGDNRQYFETDLEQLVKQGIWRQHNFALLRWWLYFLFAPYTINTYSNFFYPQFNQVSGDITPNYYFLNENIVTSLAKQIPNTKIIIILRNPIDRVWSYIFMQIKNKQEGFSENPSEKELERYLADAHSWWKPYTGIINLWSKNFQNFHIGYYDHLRENPVSFYKEICDFLQIRNDIIPYDVSEIVNKGNTMYLPEKLRASLNRIYLTEILDLEKLTKSPYVFKWLDQ